MAFAPIREPSRESIETACRHGKELKDPRALQQPHRFRAVIVGRLRRSP
jgi:hypothetical protein